MKRAQIDAFCGCRETLYQRIAFFAAPAILLAGIVYVAVRYAQLPAEIPSHSTFYGEIDGYGSVPLADQFKIYRTYGVLREQQKKDILVGKQ